MNAVHLASVDLNLLVVLHELLRSGSTTEAARRLGRTQSAVSHALRRLRASLGDPLFVRAGAALRPTARAEELRGPLGELLASAEALLSGASAAAFDPARLERAFVLCANDYAEVMIMPRLLPRLAREARGVEVRTRFLGDEVDRAVQAREVDLAVGTGFRELAGVMTHKLFDDRFACVVRERHPLATPRPSVDQYTALDHVLVAPRGLPGSAVDDALALLGRRRRIALRLPHFVPAALIVAQTDLCVTLPRRVARELARFAPLRVLPVPVALPPLRFAQLFSASWRDDPAHRWFRRCVADALREGEAGAAR